MATSSGRLSTSSALSSLRAMSELVKVRLDERLLLPAPFGPLPPYE